MVYHCISVCKKHSRLTSISCHWSQEIGHRPDDRLCTTLIRLCSAHGAAAQALGLYEWMKSPASAGGAGLKPTVFTYTAAMRAAMNGNLPERAMKVCPLAIEHVVLECILKLCGGRQYTLAASIQKLALYCRARLMSQFFILLLCAVLGDRQVSSAECMTAALL